MWRSENNILELFFSVHHVGVRDGTWVDSLDSKQLFPLAISLDLNTLF